MHHDDAWMFSLWIAEQSALNVLFDAYAYFSLLA